MVGGWRGGGIVLKSPREIELMRAAGNVVYRVLADMRKLVKPGVATRELNRRAEEIIGQAGGTALFKGVVSPQARYPFPAALCVSVNEEVVHGIPGDRILREGDIVSVDCGVRLNGYCGDAAVTVPIGRISAENRRLMETTKEVLGIAIAGSRPGVLWSRIAGQMQRYAESARFSVVRDFVGHGIGTKMHEDPKVPNFVSDELLADDILLIEGMVLAVEPMINAGTEVVRTLGNGWTVVTRDGRFSAHFEHTIAIVKDGCDVLTRNEENEIE